jgi:hypothetical protein
MGSHQGQCRPRFRRSTAQQYNRFIQVYASEINPLSPEASTSMVNAKVEL